MSPRDHHRKPMLFRKVNTRTHHVRHGHGGEYRWIRNSKSEKASDLARGPMHAGLRHGRDYTPLFRFLLSRVGHDWSEVHSEAVARLDSEELIHWLVARCEAERRSIVCIGESSFFSGLYVDDDNRLAKVDPDLSIDDLEPDCTCCTHTFNGERFPVRRSRA